MNKAYRHVYKDGIGWVAIAENASSVSSSKGSGTVVEKSGVEVLKNFFDLRNSVVLNNGFLLKGLFAATLFCGVFVGDLRAETSQNIQDKAVSTGGTAVYVDDGGKRFIQNKQGGYIDTEGKGLIKIRDQWYRVDNYDEKGVITLSDGKKYVIPTGTLNAILYDKNYDPYMVAGSGTIREKTPVFFDIEMTLSTKNSNKIVKYDENDKKWYVYNNDGEKLYLARKKEGGQYYGLHKYSELKKNSDGVPIQDKDGYYVLSSSASVSADEVRKGNTFEDLQGNFEKLNGTPDFNKNKPTRLGLVGLDGINTMPKTYTKEDKANGKIPDGRNVGDNKDGTIRLGNVARAELDDEAVNLGQLNERLQNVKAKNVHYVSINSSEKGSGSNHDNDGAKGKDSIAIGPNAGASAEDSVAIGLNAKATDEQATALGHDAEATKLGSTAIGHGAEATGEDSYALGSQSEAQGDMAIAIGFEAKANKTDSIALGSGAQTNIEGSVALGSDSVADTEKGVAGFDFATNKQSTDATSTWKSTRGAVSVGDKTFNTTRQITNVAAGYADTDAVNVAQLKTGTKNVVKYDSDANDKITLGGLDNSANPKVADGVSITNLKAGTLSKDSKDAINGSQLYATNESITQNTNKITKNEGDITTINQKLVDFNKNSLFKVSNNGNNSQNIGLNGEIKFNAGDNIELTVANDPKGANVEYKLKKDLTGVTSIKTNNQTYKFGFANPDEDDESVIRNKDLKGKGYATSTDLSKKADLDAKNLSNKTGNTANETYADVWKTALGIKDLNTNQLFTAKADESTEGATIGANGTLNFFGDDNVIASSDTNGIKYSLNKNLTNINSITTENNGDLTIKAGNETYTFDNGDNKNAGTNVVTNDKLTTKVTEAVGASKFAIKGDNNTEGKVKLSEGLSVVGATDSGITTKAEDGKFTLSLNADKVKEIAGVDGLDDKLAAKANLNASNLTKDSDKNAWKTALGIKDLNTNQLFTAKADESTEGATIGANGTLNFFGDDNVIASSDTNGIKYSLNKNLTNINSITTENNGDLVINAGTKKYTFGDTNLVDTSVITNSDIASIFKGEKGISIDKKANQYIISYKGTGSGTGTGGITEKEVRTIIKKYIGGDNIDSSTGSTDNIVTHNVSKQETTNNKNIIAAINKINQEGIGFVHVNGEKLTLNANGKSENDSSAEGKNAIAIGPRSKANGENSIAIGVRNVVTGNNSGAFGDPSIVAGIDSYSVGNNNEINSNDTFVLGNKVRVGADMQGAVVLGNKSTADKATKVSSATVEGITYDGFKGQAKDEGMILSVGAKNAERQIKNVAAGEISENSTDAVNGSQLYATNKIIGNVADSVANVIGGDAKVNKDGKISVSTNIGGTGKSNINEAIAYINNNNTSGNQYISIDVPSKGKVPIASKGSNSIVIGAGSSDNGRKNVVSVGNATTGLNRTITNVAPGKYGTDAVNMNQLYGVAGGLSKQINDVKKKSSAGIAGAVALGMLPQSNLPGDALVSIGTGYHDSESAVALGISKTSDNARWIFKGGVSYDSQDEVTAGASVGFHF